MSKKAGVSLMASEILEEVSKLDGLCTKKFKADFYTKGVDYSTLKIDDIIEIEGKKIKISRVGKPCFDECTLPNKPCILNKNVAFGEYIY